jgi:hypothetical protein
LKSEKTQENDVKVYIGRYPSTAVLKRNPGAEQKKRVRIDAWDTWNMAETLAEIILPMLKQLREDKHGSPGDMPAFSDDTNHQWPQMTFDFYKEEDSKAWDLGHKQWEAVMDKMIWSFEQIVLDDRDSQFHSGTHDIRWVPVLNAQGAPTGNSQMVKGPNDTAVFDSEGYKKYYAKIQEGLDLFGKYYMNLWD